MGGTSLIGRSEIHALDAPRGIVKYSVRLAAARMLVCFVFAPWLTLGSVCFLYGPRDAFVVWRMSPDTKEPQSPCRRV